MSVRVGVDVGGTKIEVVAMGADGAILARERVDSPPGYTEGLATIAALVGRVAPGDGPVGLGVPGSPSPADGRMRNANSTWLNGKDLAQDLESALARPVRLANDADCFALSEARDGAGQGADVVFGVILGTGVGAGVVVDGRLLSGPCGVAGEWGHNPLPWANEAETPGPLCWCGKRGCLETWLSGPGLGADHARRCGQDLSAAAIAEAAAAGDPTAQATLRAHADRLARGLAGVINILDPDVIVLGGGVSNLDGLPEAVSARLPAYVFSDVVRTRVVRHAHGDSSGVRGAAWLWDAA